jgi:phenylpropionate dioxygenase-like ring-hydroxylating dioxygenase large terminal subunit
MTPQAAAALVQPHQVHRDIYLSDEVFALEMRELWPRSWLFVGHASQVPRAGNFATALLGDQPVLMVRQADGGVAVLLNRCAHKGAPLATEPAGHFDRYVRCPYHGWTYRLDGRLAGVPLKAGYDDDTFGSCPAQRGLAPYGEVAVHRDFVFARARCAAGDASFEAGLGETLAAIDLLADRSPQGRLQVAGGVLRTEFRANWKIYFENIVDALHPVTAHASVTTAASAAWGQPPEGTPVPLALRQLLPFGSGTTFYEQMGARLLPHGHGVLGTQHSIHSGYAALGDYRDALVAAHGAERADQVLGFVPQNVVFYPSMALKGAPQVMRVLRPLAADRTVVEAWAFQPEGAPPELLVSALTYNRQVFSPLSMVTHDDLHLFEGIQRHLVARANPWVNLQRGARGTAGDAVVPRETNGIDEALMRHHYRHWAAVMAAAARDAPREGASP